jgi:hypothetical protein
MKWSLYDAALVRRINKAVKARLSREGKKRAKARWWKGGAGGGSKWFWLIWLVVNLVRLAPARGSDAAMFELLSCLSLAMTAVAFSSARKLAVKLSFGDERRVLWFYPISDRDFFLWTTQRYVARTIWVFFVAALVYSISVPASGVPGWSLRIAGAIGEWLVVLCAILALVRHVDMIPRWLPVSFYTLAVIVFFAAPFAKTTRPLALALPTGWLHFLMTAPLLKPWSLWIILLVIPALAFLVFWLAKQIEKLFIHEPAQVQPEPEQRVADSVDRYAAEQVRVEREEQEAAEEVGEDGETEATIPLPLQAAWQKQRVQNWGSQLGEVVREGSWLNAWDWNAMLPIERASGWCLNQREKFEAQFLLGPTPPAWSNRWRTAAIATAVGVAAALPGNYYLNILAIAAFAVSIGAGLPVLGGVWPATNQGRLSGKLSPIFASYPLSYWSAGRTMFKANAVRTIAWIPLGLMIGICNARTANVPLAASCWIVLRAILLFLAVTPILLSGKFSKVTNDTANLRLRTIPLIVLFIVVITVLALLSVGVFATDTWWPILFLAAIALVSWGSWAGYGWYYERAQVDLLRDRT